MSATKQRDIATDWLGYVAKAAGGLVMLLGSVVMMGWLTGSTTLVQLRPQLVPMQFNSALGFVFCGVGLLSLLYKRSRLAMGCGGLSAGLALVVLLQYPLGADFSIDRLLFEPGIVTKTASPGRMASSTALAHLLSGLALLLLAGRCWPGVCLLMVRVFAMGVFALGLGNLLGYAVGGETPYGWSHPTYMAAHTAVGFMLLGVGLLAYIWRPIAGPDQRTSHSLALESGIGLAILAVILWQSLLAQERFRLQQNIGRQRTHLVRMIEETIESEILAIMRMARRWEDQGGTPHALWKTDAARYIKHNPGLQALSWVDPSLHVRWIEPLQGNEAAKGLYLPFEPRRAQALETARLKRIVTATRNIELVQRGTAIVVYVPLYIDGRFDGFIGGVFRIDKLLAPIVTSLASKDFRLELFEGNEEIYRRVEPGAVYEPGLSQEQAFDVVNLDWRLRLQPSQALLAELGSPLPLIALMVGLLLSLLLSLAMDRAHAARQRAGVLALEVAERKRTQEALAESELWQRGIFDALVEGVMVATPDRVMVNMNPASQTILGYSQAEIAGQPTAMVHVDRDHAVEFGRRIKAAFDKGEAARFEFELKRKNGEVFPCENTVSLIKNEQGGAIGIVSTLRDITMSKQVEEELHRYREHLQELVADRTRELEASNVQLHQEIVERKQSEDQLKAQTLRNEIILATTQDGFWMVDLEGNVCDVNKAYCRMVGYTREQLQAMTVADLEASETPEEVRLHIQKIVSQGHDRFESRHRRKDGTVIDLDVSTTLANLGGTQVFFTFFRDISERKQIEVDLNASRENLQRLTAHLQTVREEERTLIARDVHDELGQVLTALNMDVHWLRKRIPEDQAEMKRKVLSLLSLIASAIESVQRITSELRPAMLDELGLGPAIQWYIEEFQNRNGIKCQVSIELDKVQLDTDRATVVFRILQEALTNVIRHAGASQVSLKINSGDDHIDMWLTDNGAGIDLSALDQESAFGILGMRERALAFGGKVDIRGHSGEGTTVMLHLPMSHDSIGM